MLLWTSLHLHTSFLLRLRVFDSVRARFRAIPSQTGTNPLTMKMVQRPSSPTSLLWAHQLKREHGHLLTRIQAVEATNERNENRIKGAESAASSAQSNDVAALAKQVKALHEAGLGKRLAKIERDVREKLEDVQAGSEAMVLKIAALERDEAKVEEERKRGFGKEKAMLKRVGEIEEVVKKNGEELKQLGQADESEHIRDLKQAIEAVAKHVKRGGDEAKVVAKKVAALEAANDELKKTNERLVTQVASIAERPATVQARQMPNPFVKPVVKPASRPAPKQAVGSVLDDEPRSQDPRAPACLNCRKRHRRCDRARPTCKNCSEIGATCQWNSEPSQAAPSQQRAPKKPTASQVDGRRERKGVAAPVPRKRKADDEDADRPVIRAGKGWIEVAVTPSASDDEDGGSPE